MSAVPVILAAACTFPSGPLIELADVAVHTSLSLLHQHPAYTDSSGSPVRVSFFPDESAFDASRWAMLLRNALDQSIVTLDGMGVGRDTHACFLWLVIPDPVGRPGLPTELLERVLEAARQAPLPWRNIQVVSGGHAAGVAAIECAMELVSASPDALAVVVRVESGLSNAALTWLDLQSLLHGAQKPVRGGFRSESHGRVPGEGAAALVLAAPSPRGPPGWASLLGCGLAEESITHAVPEPCTGAGLTGASRQALQQSKSHSGVPVGYVTVDLNGEPYRADQFGFTALRLSDALQPGWRRIVPALASGDLGSASAVAHVALAAYSLHQRPQNTNHLVLASSDDSLRGAVLLGAVEPPSRQMEVRSWR